MTEWDVGVGYDRRFSDLLLQPAHGGEKGPVKHVPLAAIIKQFGVRPAEIRTAKRDSTRVDVTMTETAICVAALPEDCTGMRALDIGGYDGRYGKIALDRGAVSDVCLDNEQYLQYGWEKPAPLPGVEYVNGDFMYEFMEYDLVICFMVIYHTKNPWDAAVALRRLTGKRLALASLVTQDDQDTWRICEPYEVNPTDATVYWAPSETGLYKLLRNVGFTHVERVGKAGDRLALVAE